MGALEQTIRTVARYIGGIPADNLRGYALGALRWMAPEVETAYQDWIKTADKSGLAGLKGEALETRMGDILKNRLGRGEPEAAKELAALYEAGYKGAAPSDTPGTVTVDGDERKLDAWQKQLYDNVWKETVGESLGAVVASEEFQEAAQEDREKMLKGLYSYAGELSKAEVFDDYAISNGAEKAREILRSGLDMAGYLALKENGGVDRYLKAAANGMEPEAASRAAIALAELEPEEGKESVSNLQRYEAITNMPLSDEDKGLALETILRDKALEKYQTARDAGIRAETYCEFLMEIGGLSGDGKKQQVWTYIDGLPLSREQKDALHLAAGYQESTKWDAPWH